MIIQISCPQCHRTNKLAAQKIQEQPKCGACQSPLLAGKPIDVNSNQFTKHRQYCQLPLLVDFWADWCAPCKMMTTVLEQIALTNPKLQVLKLNTEHNPDLAHTYQIRSLPTLILFKYGKEITRQSGALNRNQLQQWLAQHQI